MINEIKAKYLIVFPTNLDVDSDLKDFESVDFRVITAFEFNPKIICSIILPKAIGLCEKLNGRLYYKAEENSDFKHSDPIQFLEKSGVKTEFSVENLDKERDSAKSAGYFLHPLYHTTNEDSTLSYQI